MAGDGTSFQIDIETNAAGVEPAAAAVARLANELTSAQSAAAQAANAVRAGESAYAAAEASASRAALAVERIGVSADAQRGKLQAAMDVGDNDSAARAAAKLSQLVARQSEAAAKATASSAAMNAEAAALDKLKTAAGGAAAAEAKVSKSLEAAQKAATSTAKAQQAAAGSGKLNEMAEGFGKIGGPLGTVGQKALGTAEGFKKLTASLGEAGLYAGIAVGIAAIVAVLALLAVGAVVATASIAGWAVGLADAARSQSLLYAGMAKSVEGGAALGKAIDGVANRVPLATKDIEALAKPLVEAGLKGHELESALGAAAEKAAEVKLGPDFMKQMNSLPFLTSRLQKSFSRIFSGLKIEPLLEALGKMVSLFDEGTASSNAIKAVFESLFQPLVDGATGFIPKMIGMFIQFEIFVMKAAIQIKLWGKEIDAIAAVFGTLAAVVGVVLAVALGVIIGVMAAVIATTYAFWSALAAVGNIMTSIHTTIATAFVNAFTAVMAFLNSINLSTIGTDLINGLVKGITEAGPAILKAISGAVTGAINGVKSLLGIASPSKVFAEIGGFTGEGMVQGVDDSAGGVQDSLESMVSPPELSAVAPAVAGGEASGKASAESKPAGGAGGTYTITINAAGGDGPSIAEALRNLLADLGAQAGTAAA